MTALRVWRALRRRLGHRGACLLFFGQIAALYGWSLAFPPRGALTAINQHFADILPLNVWAIMWGVVSITCFACAFKRHDRLAWVALVAMIGTWAFFTVMGMFVAHPPIAVGAASIWCGLTGFVWVMAEWPEARRGEDDDD